MRQERLGIRGAPPDCTRCPELVDNRTQVVNGVGTCSSGLVLIGEAPGRAEDREGEPFVGRSGEVLDDALGELGLGREETLITNVVRCRPPDNRDPRNNEARNCREFLEREISACDPFVICTLGRVAASSLLGRPVSVGRDLGREGEVEIGDLRVPLVIDYHPAATLYDTGKRPVFVEALRTAVETLDR